jgi:aubergine-like protein
VHLTEKFNNKDNDVSQNLINVILKQAFRETNLKQLGRSPRFFDVSNPVNLDRFGLRMWSGFKASAF